MMAKVQNMNRRGRFWVLLGLLLALIMMRYALQIDIPRILFLAIVGLIAFWGDRDEIIAVCISLIPMHASLDFFYALVLCSVVYIFKFHRQIRFGLNVLLVLLVAVWELLHCFSTSFSIVSFLTCVIPFIFLAILIASDVEKVNYHFIIRAFIWSIFGVSLMLFIRVLYFADFNITYALAGLQRIGSDSHSNIQNVEIVGGQINSNSLGIITVLASTSLMQLRSIRKIEKFDVIIMCITLVLAALGASRTYLLCLVLMSVLLIFSEKGGFYKKIRLLWVLCFTITLVTILFVVLFPDTFAYYVGRFSDSDITSERKTLMALYHKFIVDNPRVLFFGIGLQNYGERLVYSYKVAFNAPHNSIQEIIIAWGIPGLILFAIQFFNMYLASSRKNRNQSLINWIPLIIILFKGLAGQTLTSPYTMLALSLAYLSLCQDFSGTKGSDEVSL